MAGSLGYRPYLLAGINLTDQNHGEEESHNWKVDVP